MKPFENFKGIVAPLDKMNVDTDQIIPKQFLKRIERTGFGEFLFYDWRYLDDGKPNPDFILNKEGYKNSQILLAKDNFGSGSSREHAPWSLEDYGFKVIIAPSFADIFYNNCFKNGMLPIILSSDLVDYLFKQATTQNGYMLDINLDDQIIKDDSGWSTTFDIDPFKKKTLLEGLDDIALTLQLQDHISSFEQSHTV
ncbi:MAG TPA: 3-isopropylmalate dehydratase small subunit [Thermodesulfobacteriota bacterium]|nr:3-isopropylmalate dehydratase small subunit [Thermodesulfobacteriota bacterium]